MELSKTGLNLIKEAEGFRDTCYPDSANLPTIGYGTLIDAPEEQIYKSKKITEEEAEQLLLKDVRLFEIQLKKYLSKPLTQNQYDAIVAFVYNVGIGNFRVSELYRVININPDDDYIANLSSFEKKQIFIKGKPELMDVPKSLFHRFISADGKKIFGLVNRRTMECKLYNTK